jgi:hypothetical protein
MKVAANILWLAALGLLAVGAWALISEQGLWGYSSSRIVSDTSLIAGVLLICASFLFPNDSRQQVVGPLGRWLGMEEPGGRKWVTGGGVGVILATGSAAAGGLGFFDGSRVGAVLGMAVIVLTLGGAFALHRFVARHGDEIGEARFDTSNKEDSRP